MEAIMGRIAERTPEQHATSLAIWPSTKAKLKRIHAVTRHNYVTMIDIAIDHELDRLGLARPEADSPPNLNPGSET